MQARQKVLITGASGLLGREVRRRLSGGAEVQGWAFRRAAGLESVDLRQGEAVAERFRAFGPSAVVHCAAERRPDVMERNPQESRKLNVEATAWLAELCAEAGAYLLFLSTDFVFDGTQPPYGEEAEPHPLNLYARSKAEAEEAVRATAREHCILRVPILYGPTRELEESAVTILAGALLRSGEGEILLDDGAVRYPTLTTDVAEAIAFLLGRRLTGTIHCSAEEPYTKYGMAVGMAPQLRVAVERIFPDPGPAKGARRPLNAHLDNTRLRRLGFHRYTPFREGIAAVLAGALGRSGGQVR